MTLDLIGKKDFVTMKNILNLTAMDCAKECKFFSIYSEITEWLKKYETLETS
jgi:hypothetical protein